MTPARFLFRLTVPLAIALLAASCTYNQVTNPNLQRVEVQNPTGDAAWNTRYYP